MIARMDIDPRIKVRGGDLLNAPVWSRVTEVNSEAADAFSDGLMKAMFAGQPFMPLVIDSAGGDVYALLTMLDLMRAAPLPVATICTGKAFSCAAVLLANGARGMRWIAPSATVLIHDVTTSVESTQKTNEAEVDARETKRLSRLVFRALDRGAERDRGTFADLVHSAGHTDVYLSAT